MLECVLWGCRQCRVLRAKKFFNPKTAEDENEELQLSVLLRH